MASEDHNLYTFDIRNLETPTQIYKGHVAGVMGCEWSPTGEEFVSGGWDRTVRLWNRDAGKSRDVYHTKRMQRYVCAFPYQVFQRNCHLTRVVYIFNHGRTGDCILMWQNIRRHLHPHR